MEEKPKLSSKSHDVHWAHCLAIAANRNGTIKMAAAIFQAKTKTRLRSSAVTKYLPEDYQWGMLVRDVFPGFVKGKGKEDE